MARPKKRIRRPSRQLIEQMVGDLSLRAEVAGMAAGTIATVATIRPREETLAAANAQLEMIRIAAAEHQRKMRELAEFARMIRGNVQ